MSSEERVSLLVYVTTGTDYKEEPRRATNYVLGLTDGTEIITLSK